MGRKALCIGAAIIVVAVVACAAIVLNDDDDGDAKVIYESGLYAQDPVSIGSNIVADCMFERDGFTFTGWITSEDGDGVVYQPGDVLDFDSGTMRLWAIWSPMLKSVGWSMDPSLEFPEKLVMVYDDDTEAEVGFNMPVPGHGIAHGTISVTCGHYTWTMTVDEDGDDVFRGVSDTGEVCMMSIAFVGATRNVEASLDDGGRPTYSFEVGGGFSIIVSYALEDPDTAP